MVIFAGKTEGELLQIQKDVQPLNLWGCISSGLDIHLFRNESKNPDGLDKWPSGFVA